MEIVRGKAGSLEVQYTRLSHSIRLRAGQLNVHLPLLQQPCHGLCQPHPAPSHGRTALPPLPPPSAAADPMILPRSLEDGVNTKALSFPATHWGPFLLGRTLLGPGSLQFPPALLRQRLRLCRGAASPRVWGSCGCHHMRRI